jgi:hypothetical protein
MICGLLSWYQEKPGWLAATVASMQPFCDHIVAVDGAYFLYPGGRAHSGTDQAEAIRETARSLNMGCTIHEPQKRWAGNETEKRSTMFRLGECATTSEDWYFVIDGDEVVTDTGGDLRARVAEARRDVGEVTLWKHRDLYHPSERPFVTPLVESQTIRVMFRAIRGLSVVGNHYTYVTPDGRFLWGKENLEPAEDFTTVRLEHRNGQRDLWRAKESRDYYATRDDLNIEGLEMQTTEQREAYIKGLVVEREGYVRTGTPEQVACVDAELARVRGEAKAPAGRAERRSR